MFSWGCPLNTIQQFLTHLSMVNGLSQEHFTALMVLAAGRQPTDKHTQRLAQSFQASDSDKGRTRILPPALRKRGTLVNYAKAKRHQACKVQ